MLGLKGTGSYYNKPDLTTTTTTTRLAVWELPPMSIAAYRVVQDCSTCLSCPFRHFYGFMRVSIHLISCRCLKFLSCSWMGSRMIAESLFLTERHVGSAYIPCVDCTFHGEVKGGGFRLPFSYLRLLL